MKTFDTTIIDLASAILTEIPGASFEGIDKDRKVNGKDLIKIKYPEQEEESLLKIQHDFNNRVLFISLYEFNLNRRLIVDKLFGRRGKWNGSGHNGSKVQ